MRPASFVSRKNDANIVWDILIQRAENKNYYTDEDYKAVGRKIVKLCLIRKTRPRANRMR